METIDFTYVVNNEAHVLPVIVSEGRIVMRNIVQLLGLHWSTISKRLPIDYGAVGVKGNRTNSALALLPLDLDKWITDHAKPGNVMHEHVAKNLIPTIRQKSTDLRVSEALKARAVAERAAEVTIVGLPLEAPDIFRQQATRGGAEKWVPPALIDGAVRRKRLDTFRVVDNIWTETKEIIHVQMTIAPGASLQEFSRLHKAGELLTGPEMQAKFPDSPLLKRHTVAEHDFAVVDDNTDNPRGRVVKVPAQPSKFPWEKDLEAVPKPKGENKC
jgi:hypothetical protein